MLLFPLAFASKLGSALLTFAPVRLDSSSKENECASAHDSLRSDTPGTGKGFQAGTGIYRLRETEAVERT